jgi:hypothetical protein
LTSLPAGISTSFPGRPLTAAFPPNPQTNPPVPPWQNNVVQLLNGTCGTGPDTSIKYRVDPSLWHVSNPHKTYYFSVVDINGDQVKVTNYKGYTGDYTVFDTFTLNQPGLVPALSKWSTAFCAVVLLIIAFALIRRRAIKQY